MRARAASRCWRRDVWRVSRTWRRQRRSHRKIVSAASLRSFWRREASSWRARAASCRARAACLLRSCLRRAASSWRARAACSSTRQRRWCSSAHSSSMALCTRVPRARECQEEWAPRVAPAAAIRQPVGLRGWLVDANLHRERVDQRCPDGCSVRSIRTTTRARVGGGATTFAAHVGCRCRQFLGLNVVSGDMSATAR